MKERKISDIQKNRNKGRKNYKQKKSPMMVDE